MFVLIVGSWLGLSVIVAVCAVKKNLEGFDYFLLSLVLSPLIGFAIVTLKETPTYSWPKEGILPRAQRLKRVATSRRARIH